MSRDDSKTLVCNYIEAVWNRADLAALEELTLPSYTYRFAGQPARDRNAMRQFVQAVHVAFPDWRVRIQAIVAEGDVVAARWDGSATHRGPFQGIPATGKEVRVSGINVYAIQEGKIAQEWEQMDSLGMLQQLGILLPPKSQASESPNKASDGD